MASGESGSSLRSTAIRIFGGLAPAYDYALAAATLFQDRRWKAWVLYKVRSHRPKLILDVGCGTCVLEERLEGTGVSVVGVDISASMIRRGGAKRLKCVKMLVVGDAEHLPFRDGSFESVVSCYVAKYCKVRTLASELSRVGKDGCRIAIYDFVRPRGTYSILLRMYVYGLLPFAGGLLRRIARGLAVTFQELPAVIGKTTWDDEFEEALKAEGVSVTEVKSMTGIVRCFSCLKPQQHR